MQRSIRFSKYRNLGLEKDDYLILNGDFQKGKMGNLVILIGPNNSGKSNVLDGIVTACTNSGISKRDITDLYFEDKYRTPSLALVYRDDKYTFEYQINSNNNAGWKIIAGSAVPEKPSTEEIKKTLNAMFSYFNQRGMRMQNLVNLISGIESKNIKGYDSILEETINVINYMVRNGYANDFINKMRKEKNSLIYYYDSTHGSQFSFIQEYLSKETGLTNPVPNCIVYRENQISNNDLYTREVNNLQNYRFFRSLFKTINVETKTIQNVYNQYYQTNNIQYLKKLEKDLAKKIDKLSDRFNNLYFASNDKYKFTLVFESERISFGMARGKEEEPINLEYQSTGFKWFFNLFFNFLANGTLKPGDIVIMDEPATNLHVQGQNELRAFIKQFAIENDVLFVLATHSPFLIDVDHYDELRVITMENNRSRIDNRFTAVNLEDPDSLLPIKESLTIKQNVLYDLDTEVYFVEGITDYNYLTMFKHLLNVKNIAFLPFNGVGNNSNQTKKILGELLKVKFHKRSLLVDSDKAGEDMYKQAKDSAFDSIHRMAEIKLTDTKNAVMVEDLFSAEDKKKFRAIVNKNSDGTSAMKDHCKLGDFSKTTVDHFKELFKILQD